MREEELDLAGSSRSESFSPLPYTLASRSSCYDLGSFARSSIKTMQEPKNFAVSQPPLQSSLIAEHLVSELLALAL